MSEIKHTSEAGHWYDRFGNPAYTTIGANKKERPTTLRDARKDDLVPSVTTVMKVAAAPGLERWKQEQVLLAALTLPKAEGESESDWINRIMEDSKETGRKAADRGTEIHAAIQNFYDYGIADVEFEQHTNGCRSALNEHFGHQAWICEKSFAHVLGYGGKVDLHAKSELEGEVGVVVDIKTKDFGPDDKISGFDEHMMQLAAYRMGLLMPKARCANVFVSRSHPGLCHVIEWDQEDIERGWGMFTRLLDFWQIKNNHR
jgi:hypothetical protein